MALWTPAEIATSLWLDASDADTLTLNAELITEWMDKSGSGRHATQSVAGSKPSFIAGGLGGLDIASFDGSADFLNLATPLTITTDMVVVMVIGRPTASTISQPMGGTVVNGTPYPTQWWSDNVMYTALGSTFTTHGTASTLTGSFVLATTRTSTLVIARRNGTQLGTAQTAPSVGSNVLAYIGRRGATYHNGTIAEIVVINAVEDVGRLEGYLAWKWGLQAGLPVGHPYKAAAPVLSVMVPVIAGLAGEYGDAASPSNALTGIYSLCLEQALIGRYGDAALIKAALVGRYADAAKVQAALIGRYGDTLPVFAALEGRYHLMHAVLAGLEGRYAITGAEVLAGLEGRYDLRERNEIAAALVGYYSLLPGATLQNLTCPVLVGGVAVNWATVQWSISEDSYLIEATISLRDAAEFGSIARNDQVQILWQGTAYTLFVAAKLRSRSVSGSLGAIDYGVEYTIIARSLTAALDEPYALPQTLSWPATTLASAIAAELIAPLSDIISLDWRLEDWLQPGGTFFLTDETPLAGLRKLAGIAGGILQTSPDNALIIRRADPVPPRNWATAEPGWIIEDSGLFSDSESEAISSLANVITVTNQSTGDSSIRFETETIDSYRHRVKGYRVPWVDFRLKTSGGSWVTIEDMGVVAEPITETVEFVDGAATASKPVYSAVAVTWLRAQLGAITASEDGSLTAEVLGATLGCSLAEITYTTRYHAWIGRSDRDEEVQFFAEEIV